MASAIQFALIAGLLAAALALWWRRRRRAAHVLAEEVVCSSTAEEITSRLTAARAETEASEPDAGRKGRVPSRRQTLLLVASEQAVAQRMLALVTGSGRRVVLASTGEEALEMSGRFEFDAVLCDVRLPCMSWAGLFDRIRGPVKARILLADGCDRELSRAVAAAGGLVLARPVTAEDLERALLVVE